MRRFDQGTFRMKVWTTLVLALMLCGCGHRRLETVTVALPGPVNPQYLIYIETISTDKIIEEERLLIEEMFAPMLQKALEKKGYRAQVATSGPPRGASLTLRGVVTHYRPGSKKARTWPEGSGGYRRLFTSFTLENYYNQTTVTQFMVVSTSGKFWGYPSTQAYLQVHLQKAANKAADYLAGPR
jgi:hypothetical protein